MKPHSPKRKRGPEREIQDRIIDFLKVRDWVVMETHGNEYQHGFPDLYAMHPLYGQRWIEVKKPVGYVFTNAQHRFFPLFLACKIGIWIMVEANETEYQKLFEKPNLWKYYKL